VWIHPFVDGNGRVARLMSHAMLLETLDTGAVWSVARGLARNVETYKARLAACDQTRRNDLDGRGNLSDEALAEFTEFFLQTCIDQVTFMESLMQPARLRARILIWAEEEVRLGQLPPRSGNILEAVLYRGELPRGEAPAIVGTAERQARRAVSGLVERGVLSSETPRGPLRLVFPATLASRWMPGLFPERAAG
jgi:Fic family protein